MDDLNQLRIIKLREMAKEKNIKRYYKMNKADLIAALSHYSQIEEKTINQNIKIKPNKRSPVIDNKLELKNVLKQLGRTECIKTKAGFQDNYQGQTINYQIVLVDNVCKLLIEKNDLLKQFDLQNKEMWKEIFQYLRNVIYTVLETVEAATRILDVDEEKEYNYGGFLQPEEEVFQLTEQYPSPSPETKEVEKEEGEEKEEEGEEKEGEEKEGEEKEGEEKEGEEEGKPAPPSSPPSPIASPETTPDVPKIPYSEEERLPCAQKGRPVFLKKRLPSFLK